MNDHWNAKLHISTTMVMIITVASSTRTTHPTTMPTVEHPPPEPDCAGLTFTVVSRSVYFGNPINSVVVISGTVVSAVDIDIVVGSENKN